jgi:hypothetical protein
MRRKEDTGKHKQRKNAGQARECGANVRQLFPHSLRIAL